MRAIQVHQYGHADQMMLEDVPQPKVSKGQVLVKVHDAGVNPLDWKIREGYMKSVIPLSFPYTMGQDFSGEVVEIGEGVEGYSEGDHVFGFAQGSYAEYALATPEGLAHIAPSVDDAAAAAIPTAGLTAWQIVTDIAKVSKNQTILIHGAGGGVGSFAMQFAKRAGARVIAVASKDDFPYLEGLGADQLIDYKSERFEEKVKNVDTIIDVVGGDTLARSYQAVKKNGLIITTVGAADEDKAKEYNVRFVRFVVHSDHDELERLGHMLEEGSVKPRVSKIMSLSEANKADDLSQTGHPHGKIVLRIH